MSDLFTRRNVHTIRFMNKNLKNKILVDEHNIITTRYYSDRRGFWERGRNSWYEALKIGDEKRNNNTRKYCTNGLLRGMINNKPACTVLACKPDRPGRLGRPACKQGRCTGPCIRPRFS